MLHLAGHYKYLHWHNKINAKYGFNYISRYDHTGKKVKRETERESGGTAQWLSSTDVISNRKKRNSKSSIGFGNLEVPSQNQHLSDWKEAAS